MFMGFFCARVHQKAFCIMLLNRVISLHLILVLMFSAHTLSPSAAALPMHYRTQHHYPDIRASCPSPCDAACLSCLDRISQLSAATRAPASQQEGQADKKCQRKERERDSPGICQSSLCLCVYVCVGTKGLSHRS